MITEYITRLLKASHDYWQLFGAFGHLPQTNASDELTSKDVQKHQTVAKIIKILADFNTVVLAPKFVFCLQSLLYALTQCFAYYAWGGVVFWLVKCYFIQLMSC